MRPPCEGNACMKVRLFDDACGGHRPPPMCERERVVIDNPCRPGERAEVTLGVDDCGNLVICVHRMPRRDPCDGDWDRPCRPRRRPVWDGCARACRP
ncbi:MAG: hypothetical protein IJ646_00465 [Clostridia bacterium]|nr:hypothetical protein [Clostridia bacterium]